MSLDKQNAKSLNIQGQRQLFNLYFMGTFMHSNVSQHYITSRKFRTRGKELV